MLLLSRLELGCRISFLLDWDLFGCLIDTFLDTIIDITINVSSSISNSRAALQLVTADISAIAAGSLMIVESITATIDIGVVGVAQIGRIIGALTNISCDVVILAIVILVSVYGVIIVNVGAVVIIVV